MNGLKELNDTQGHQAGDKALIGIGEALHEIEDENTRAYRVGGDEFILLFFRGQEDIIIEREARVKESVKKRGTAFPPDTQCSPGKGI